jgi:SAM-dependent methyltransferase
VSGADAVTGPLARLGADPKDPDAALQAVRFELYRENIYGALEMVEAAHAVHPDPRYADPGRPHPLLARPPGEPRGLHRSPGRAVHAPALAHGAQADREAHPHDARAQDAQDDRAPGGRDPEFQALEREVAAVHARRVLDAGSGEGGVAMALASRHPDTQVDGVEVSATNVRIAHRLNRFANARFRQGLAEEVHQAFPGASFDLVYSFAVLEHVRDVDETIRSIMTVLRPGGRFCFVVPMHEFRARGPIPDYAPVHGYADHCRVFSEGELYQRFGHEKSFHLQKIPGAWKHGELPPCFEPIEFGSFFVSYTK